jgi:hypothetical protein
MHSFGKRLFSSILVALSIVCTLIQRSDPARANEQESVTLESPEWHATIEDGGNEAGLRAAQSFSWCSTLA